MRVYIAGPYSKGDPVINTRNAILAGQKVLDAGHSPYIPHLTLFWHFLIPGPWQKWIDHDKTWVIVCDALIRLPGDSTGADGEMDLAKSKGLAIYYSVEDFLFHVDHNSG